LSASQPIFKDKLLATDTCWETISHGPDCRTPSEIQNGVRPRWGSLAYYISNDPRNHDSYNDLEKNFLNLKMKKLLTRLTKKENLPFDKKLITFYSYIL